MRKLRPVILGDWWLIGANPDLRGIVPGDAERRAKWEAGGKKEELNASVDHHLFQGPDGAFHLWGCVRRTAVGRVLYHWETKDIMQSPWKPTGEIFRVDRAAGESINDVQGQEWIQSPYFVRNGDTYYMFFGGHGTDRTDSGEEIPAAITGDERRARTSCQICLMTSKDGRTWTRYKNEKGQSRLFTGPGEARDPCVIRVGDEWLCYYTGHRNQDLKLESIFVRKSKDLIHWSESTLVLFDPIRSKGGHPTECAHVVYREGYYYAFRTEDYYAKKTFVYRSENPFDFGIDEGAEKTFVCEFPAAAVEIYEFNGKEYASSSHNPQEGEFLARLGWEKE